MRRLALILLLICATALFSQAKMTVGEFELEIFRLTNVERAKHGLPALLPESGFTELARRHGRSMAKNDYFDHKDREGLLVGGRQKKYYKQLMTLSMGENLAFFEHSQKKFSPSKVVTGWMNSPGHRENILEPSFTHLGVAVVVKEDKLWAVQNFGHPVLKLTSGLPSSCQRNRIYKLDFEYLGVEDSASLQALLVLPDKKTIVPIGGNRYVEGIQPLGITWRQGRHFSLEVPFSYGKGSYRLAFGWGDGHYETDFVFKVK